MYKLVTPVVGQLDLYSFEKEHAPLSGGDPGPVWGPKGEVDTYLFENVSFTVLVVKRPHSEENVFFQTLMHTPTRLCVFPEDPAAMSSQFPNHF